MSFCSSPVYPLHGITFVRNDAKNSVSVVLNVIKHSNNVETQENYVGLKHLEKLLVKELVVDSTLTFAARRNVPVR